MTIFFKILQAIVLSVLAVVVVFIVYACLITEISGMEKQFVESHAFNECYSKGNCEKQKKINEIKSLGEK